jgi:hypothetical protein
MKVSLFAAITTVSLSLLACDSNSGETPQGSLTPIPGLTDHWRDVIDANGTVIFINQDKIWQENGRVFAVIRKAQKINGTADYTRARDLVAATDCRTAMGIFEPSQDYRRGQLQSTGGLGLALVGAMCRR